MPNRLLIVDSDESVGASLKSALEPEGYSIEIAVNADDALAALEADGITLVLLDPDLPDRNGWTVLDRITRRSPTIPVAMITKHLGPTWENRVGHLAPLLRKPLNANDVLTTITQLLDEPREIRLRRFCAFLETQAFHEEAGNGC